MTEVIISFPGIGIDAFSIDKVAFELPFFGGLEVRWYGIILTLGIIAGLCYALYRTKTEGISADDIMDYALWTVMLAIIGARPAECIFVDNTAKNLVAAEEVGISPVLFDRDGDHYYGASVLNFEELYNLIG
jgi:hypothetical protein